jgi:hypothetical protein
MITINELMGSLEAQPMKQPFQMKENFSNRKATRLHQDQIVGGILLFRKETKETCGRTNESQNHNKGRGRSRERERTYLQKN